MANKRIRQSSSASEPSPVAPSTSVSNQAQSHVLFSREDLDDIVSKTIISAMSTLSEEINSRMDLKCQELSERMDVRDSETFEMEKRLDSAEAKILQIQGELKESNVKIKLLENRYQSALAYANDNEQYSRKSSLRVYGLPFEANENCTAKVVELFNSALNLQLEASDLDSAHRLPARRGDNRPPPIIVKLIRRSHKIEVIKQKATIRQYTDQRVRVTDDVTRLNSKLITRLNEHPDISSAWFYNGKVFAHVEGCHGRVRVRPFEDIAQVVHLARRLESERATDESNNSDQSQADGIEREEVPSSVTGAVAVTQQATSEIVITPTRPPRQRDSSSRKSPEPKAVAAPPRANITTTKHDTPQPAKMATCPKPPSGAAAHRHATDQSHTLMSVLIGGQKKALKKKAVAKIH